MGEKDFGAIRPNRNPDAAFAQRLEREGCSRAFCEPHDSMRAPHESRPASARGGPCQPAALRQRSRAASSGESGTEGAEVRRQGSELRLTPIAGWRMC
jgi:hypothetical protein